MSRLSITSSSNSREEEGRGMSHLSISPPHKQETEKDDNIKEEISKIRSNGITSPTTKSQKLNSSRKRSWGRNMSNPSSEEEENNRQRANGSGSGGGFERRLMMDEKKNKKSNGNDNLQFFNDNEEDEDEEDDSYVDSYVANHAERSFCGNLDGEEAPPLGSSSSEKFRTLDTVPLEARAFLPVSPRF
jgi:hypothetical protein